MTGWHGYGRARPPGRRQIAGGICFTGPAAGPYRRLDGAVCVSMGEARTPSDPGQPGPGRVIDIAEPIWEPIADGHAGGLPLACRAGLTGDATVPRGGQAARAARARTWQQCVPYPRAGTPLS
jgi:hypothetical protein